MSGQNETDVAYPASWWESRSSEQLQDFVRGGFVSGDMYYGAQRELERRARESKRLVDEAATDAIQHRVNQGNQIALAAAAVSFVAALGALAWMVFIR